MLNEFEIIQTFFEKKSFARPEVILGIGDDAAILEMPAEQQLIITTDTLVAGVHFPMDTPPQAIGHKALAVNLSDLAAMGATPAWFTLALTLPEANEVWLQAFSTGLFQLANQYSTQLIGGDLTRGPLSITITAHGFIPKNKGLTRSQAKPDDLIYVTNTLGDAALALKHLKQSPPKKLLDRLNYPEPRIVVGQQLHDIASAAIDISDGLIADLTHILKKSNVGARIYLEKIPLSTEFLTLATEDEKNNLPLCGGDDYELCFTIPKTHIKKLHAHANTIPLTCIGTIIEEPHLEIYQPDGTLLKNNKTGYQHF